MPALDDWFLTAEERGNPDTAIDRRRAPLAWTEANEVTPHVDGAPYLARLLDELRSLGQGDRVWILDELLDPKLGFDVWRRSAEAFDRWRRGGQRGPRPPGRARVHHPELVRWWQVWWALPLHRTAIDPDGRPSDLKRSGAF